MSTWQNDHLAEQLQEDSEDLERCGDSFEHWILNKKDGQRAWAEFQALSVGVPMPAFKDLDNARLEALFDFVQSQSKHKDAWTDYFVQSGLDAYEGARGDAMMDYERERD